MSLTLKSYQLFLGPGNKPLFVLTGEGHRDELVWYVSNAMRHFGNRISPSPISIEPAKHLKSKTEELLYFPSKVSISLKNKYLPLYY